MGDESALRQDCIVGLSKAVAIILNPERATFGGVMDEIRAVPVSRDQIQRGPTSQIASKSFNISRLLPSNMPSGSRNRCCVPQKS